MSLITQRTPTSMGKFSIRSIEKASLEDLRELEAQLLNKKEKQKSKKEKELYELREWEKEQLASLEIAKLEELEIAKLAEIRQYKYNYVDLSDREYALLKIRSPEKWCIYCGDWYQCRDHIIPVSWTGFKRSYKRGDVVPCCNECNSILYNYYLLNLNSRAEFLIEKYIFKCKKLIHSPIWNIKEIQNLGYNIKTNIQRLQYLRIVYRAKLSNLQLVIDGCDSIAINEF